MHLSTQLYAINPAYWVVAATAVCSLILGFLLMGLLSDHWDFPVWVGVPLPLAVFGTITALLYQWVGSALAGFLLILGLLFMGAYYDDAPFWIVSYTWNIVRGRQCDYFYSDSITPGETCERAAGHQRHSHWYSGGAAPKFRPWWERLSARTDG